MAPDVRRASHAPHLPWLYPRVRLGLLALLVLLLAGTGRASAHAELREASPEVGAAYRWNRPSEVRLSFSQNLTGSENSIGVTTRTFASVPLGETILDPADPFTMVAPLPDLAPGTYTVTWRTVSVDGHVLEGSYAFTILSRWSVVAPWGGAGLLLGLALLGLGLFGARRYQRATKS